MSVNVKLAQQPLPPGEGWGERSKGVLASRVSFIGMAKLPCALGEYLL